MAKLISVSCSCLAVAKCRRQRCSLEVAAQDLERFCRCVLVEHCNHVVNVWPASLLMRRNTYYCWSPSLKGLPV